MRPLNALLVSLVLTSCSLTPVQRQQLFDTGLSVLASRQIITARDADDARRLGRILTSAKAVHDPQP